MAGVRDGLDGGVFPCIELSNCMAADSAFPRHPPPPPAPPRPVWNASSIPGQPFLKLWTSGPLFSVYLSPQNSGMILVQHLKEPVPVYQVHIRHVTVPHVPKGFHEAPSQSHCLKRSRLKPLSTNSVNVGKRRQDLHCEKSVRYLCNQSFANSSVTFTSLVVTGL